MRLGGLEAPEAPEAPEACRDRALEERGKSRAQAADAELKSRAAKKTCSEMGASVSRRNSSLRLHLSRLWRKRKGYWRNWHNGQSGRIRRGRGMAG